MEEKKENKPPDTQDAPPPFDATTNFSILGWVLDKLGYRKRSQKRVDFMPEE